MSISDMQIPVTNPQNPKGKHAANPESVFAAVVAHHWTMVMTCAITTESAHSRIGTTIITTRNIASRTSSKCRRCICEPLCLFVDIFVQVVAVVVVNGWFG